MPKVYPETLTTAKAEEEQAVAPGQKVFGESSLSRETFVRTSRGTGNKSGDDDDDDDDDDELIDKARERLKESVSHRVFWLFIALSTLLAIAEPVVISFHATLSHSVWMWWQLFLLTTSTVFYIVLLIVTFYFLGVVENSLCWTTKLILLYDGEVLFETACLILGWIFIFNNPGIATLRCMRIFRMLWFFELGEHLKYRNPEDHWVSISNICYICVQYLEGIGAEIFTAKSKGGVVLLVIYFYVTYVFAVLFYIEEATLITPNDTNPTTGNATLCATITGCYLTLTRLNLYDGTGGRTHRSDSRKEIELPVGTDRTKNEVPFDALGRKGDRAAAGSCCAGILAAVAAGSSIPLIGPPPPPSPPTSHVSFILFTPPQPRGCPPPSPPPLPSTSSPHISQKAHANAPSSTPARPPARPPAWARTRTEAAQDLPGHAVTARARARARQARQAVMSELHRQSPGRSPRRKEEREREERKRRERERKRWPNTRGRSPRSRAGSLSARRRLRLSGLHCGAQLRPGGPAGTT